MALGKFEGVNAANIGKAASLSSSSIGNINGSQLLLGAWSTTSSASNSRSYSAGCGNVNDTLSFGGYNGSWLSVTDKWDGATWSYVANLPTWYGSNNGVSKLTGFGTTAAAIACGGQDKDGNNCGTVAKWNGASWTITGGTYGRIGWVGCGSTSSGLMWGGNGGGGISDTKVLVAQWNGVDGWTTLNSLNNAVQVMGGCGTTSAAMSFGGHNGSARVAITEKWNGSSWSTAQSLSQSRYGLSGVGTTTAAMAISGSTGSYTSTPAAVTTVEKWNGTAWATTNSVNVGREGCSSSGDADSALSFLGATGSGTVVGTTEIWA